MLETLNLQSARSMLQSMLETLQSAWSMLETLQSVWSMLQSMLETLNLQSAWNMLQSMVSMVGMLQSKVPLRCSQPLQSVLIQF